MPGGPVAALGEIAALPSSGPPSSRMPGAVGAGTLSGATELVLVRPSGWEQVAASLVMSRRLGDELGSDARPVDGIAAPDAAPAFELDCAGHAHEAGADTQADAPARDGGVIDNFVRLAAAFPGAVELGLPAGPRSAVPLMVQPTQALRVGLRVTVPAAAPRGSRFTLDLVQRDGDAVVGGVALQVRVV